VVQVSTDSIVEVDSRFWSPTAMEFGVIDVDASKLGHCIAEHIDCSHARGCEAERQRQERVALWKLTLPMCP
jgi:hypothetical protein